jgi:sulfotransferase family protein
MGMGMSVRTAGRLPNFLIIGAMKGGTTSLFRYLGEHPQVFTPAFKAPEFFAGKSHTARGLDWYRKQFAACPPDAIAVGEASNVYTKFPTYTDVPRRIAEHIPDARLIYVVRDPIARIRSHYQHRVTEGREKAPFETAVFENSIYTDYSRYAMQLEQYLEHFAREQLLVITSEALRHDRVATMERVYEFLGVEKDFVPANLDREFQKTQDRAARSIVPPGIRRFLKQRFPASKRMKELEANVLRSLRRLKGLPKSSSNGSATAPSNGSSHGSGNGSHDGNLPTVIDAETRERLVGLLADDVRRLREFMGEDFDGWGLA